MAPLAAQAEDVQYEVGYGDTLWDLAIRFYGDPHRWEEILQANPQLPGPGSLQPGKTIVIPDAMAGMGTGSAVDLTDYSTIRVPNRAANVPMLSRLRVETAGWVATDPVNPLGYVLAVDVEETDELRKDRAILGDLIEIDMGGDQGVQQGDVFQLARECEMVSNPETMEHFGQIIRVVGVCRVLNTTAETSIAKVEHSYLPAQFGDVIMEYSPAANISINPQPVVEELTAYVVGFRDPDLSDAFPYDVVYLTRGSNDGLEPGDMFAAYEYGESVINPAGETIQTADIPVVELVILTTTPGSSAAIVSASINSDLVQVGERLHLVRRTQ
mgnify:CR=1 FL=1